MTSLTIQLPDELVERAEQAGLLKSENLVQLLNKQLADIEQVNFAQQIFQPFTTGTNTVSNEQINQIRDLDGI